MARMSLPPGFRFRPTDVELILYFLKRKIMGKKLHFEAIAEVDIYKFNPWDLPEKSFLRSRDLEWYFFCPRNRKYPNGSRTSRATSIGYWKTTGKDRSVHHNSRTVGMKKTLIFHRRRAPNGVRTNWVMHEYRLADCNLIDTGFPQDAYVICKIFEKSGLGPKNGEEYGAPFIEDEWDDESDNNLVSLPTFSCEQSSLFNPILEPATNAEDHSFPLNEYDTVAEENSSLLNGPDFTIPGASVGKEYVVNSPGFDEYLSSLLYDAENCGSGPQQDIGEVHSEMPGFRTQESGTMEKIVALNGPKLPAIANVRNLHEFDNTCLFDKSCCKCVVHVDHHHETHLPNDLCNEWNLQQDLLKTDVGHISNEANLQQLSSTNYESSIASSEPYIELNDLLYPLWDAHSQLVNSTSISDGSALRIFNNADGVTTRTSSASVTAEVYSAGYSSFHAANFV